MFIKHSWAEPYKMKMVELLKMTTPFHRKKATQVFQTARQLHASHVLPRIRADQDNLNDDWP